MDFLVSDMHFRQVIDIPRGGRTIFPPLLKRVLYHEMPFAQYMSVAGPISHKEAHTRRCSVIITNESERGGGKRE